MTTSKHTNPSLRTRLINSQGRAQTGIQQLLLRKIKESESGLTFIETLVTNNVFNLRFGDLPARSVPAPLYRQSETKAQDTINQLLIKRFYQNYFKSRKNLNPIMKQKLQHPFDLHSSSNQHYQIYTDRGNN